MCIDWKLAIDLSSDVEIWWNVLAKEKICRWMLFMSRLNLLKFPLHISRTAS